jgi:hypothetical protein
MNGYIAFYGDRELEVYAPSSYEAWQKAVALFKPRKKQEHMVHVHLCKRADGSEVLHSTAF